MDEPVTKIAHPPHPYYPLEVEIIGYLANDWHFLTLLAAFASGVAAIFTITFALVKRTRPDIRGKELAIILWFVLCKTVFEVYIRSRLRG
jgi:cholestenol Delta-isomerase